MIKNLAYLSAFTTFIVLVWISVSIYNTIHSSTVSQNESVQIVPIEPSFNTAVISSLTNRIQVPVDLSEQIASSSSIQTPQTVVPGISAQPSPVPQLTPSTSPVNISPSLLQPGENSTITPLPNP